MPYSIFLRQCRLTWTTCKLEISLILLLWILLLPFFYAMLFTFPEGDDWPRAALALHLFDYNTALGDMLHAWRTWSGRYIHHFFVVFFGDAALHPTLYATICTTVLLVYGVGFWGIFRTVSASNNILRPILLASLCLLGLCCGYQAYDLTFTLLTEVLGIALGNAFVLLYVWGLCAVWFARTWRKTCLAAAGCTLAGLAAAGCYEHSTIAVGHISAFTFIMVLLYRHNTWRTFAFILSTNIFFIALSLFAPGNFARRGEKALHFGKILFDSAQEWVELLPMLFRREYIAVVVLTFFLLQPKWKQSLPQKIGNLKTLLLGATFCFSIMFCIIAMHTLSGYGIKGPEMFLELLSKLREVLSLENSVAYPLIKLPASMAFLGLCFAGFTVCAFKPRAEKAGITKTQTAMILCGVCLLAFSSNMKQTVTNIVSGNLQNYAETQTSRQIWLTEQREGDVTMAQLETIPYPMWPVELVWDFTEPDAWPNSSQASVFNLTKITRQPLSAKAAFAAWEKRQLGHDTYVMDANSPREALAEPLEQALLVEAIQGGPNDSFTRDWLFLWTQNPLENLSVLFLPPPGQGRLLPHFLQSALSTSFKEGQRETTSSMIRLAGPHRTFKAENWLVGNAAAHIYAFPLRKNSDKAIFEIWMSFDQKKWLQIPRNNEHP